MKNPKRRKTQKLQEAPQDNGMEDTPVFLSKPKKKRCFSKGELVSSDLEEKTSSGNISKRKKSFSEEEPVTDPGEAETGVSPIKRGNSLPKRSHSATDLKRPPAVRAATPRKRKVSQSSPRKTRMDSTLVGKEVDLTFVHLRNLEDAQLLLINIIISYHRSLLTM